MGQKEGIQSTVVRVAGIRRQQSFRRKRAMGSPVAHQAVRDDLLESIPATPASRAGDQLLRRRRPGSAPVISLFQTNRWLSSISDQALNGLASAFPRRRLATAEAALRPSSSRRGRSRPTEQAGAGQSSPPGLRPRDTTPQRASPVSRPRLRPRHGASPSVPPTSASRPLSGSRPPRPHRHVGPA